MAACCSSLATAVSSSSAKPLAGIPPASPHSLSLPRSPTAAARPLRLSASSSRSARASSFVARAGGVDDAPLVGNKAPDFDAEAVFDQEFINVKLSDYIGKKYVILPLGLRKGLQKEVIQYNIGRIQIQIPLQSYFLG